MIACSLPDITDPSWTSLGWFGSRAVFSWSLPSTVYALHRIGKSIAAGLAAGVFCFPFGICPWDCGSGVPED